MIIITDTQYLAKWRQVPEGNADKSNQSKIQILDYIIWYFPRSMCTVGAHGLFRPLVLQAERGRPAKSALTLRYHLPILSVISRLFNSSGNSETQYFKWKWSQKHPNLLKARLLLYSDRLLRDFSSHLETLQHETQHAQFPWLMFSSALLSLWQKKIVFKQMSKHINFRLKDSLFSLLFGIDSFLLVKLFFHFCMNHQKGKIVFFVALCSPLPLDVIFLISTGLLCKALQSCGKCCSAKGNL